jgi:hypothetical protein
MVRSRLILILALLVLAAVPAVALAAPGAVTLVGPSTSDEAWANAHFWRTAGPTPGGRAWVRRSAYALDAATAAAHPDWVLKSPAGSPLYLGSAFAADFGNPAYRAGGSARRRPPSPPAPQDSTSTMSQPRSAHSPPAATSPRTSSIRGPRAYTTGMA